MYFQANRKLLLLIFTQITVNEHISTAMFELSIGFKVISKFEIMRHCDSGSACERSKTCFSKKDRF